MSDRDAELARGIEQLCVNELVNSTLAILLAASRGAGRDCPRAQAIIARRLALAARAAEHDAGEARSLLSAGVGNQLALLLRDFAQDLASDDSPRARAGRRVCAHAASALADLASSRLGAAAKAALAAEGAIEALLDTISLGAGRISDPTCVSFTQACRAIGNLTFGLDDSGATACKSRVLLFACRSRRLAALDRDRSLDRRSASEDSHPVECVCAETIAPARSSGACGANILAAAVCRTVPGRGRGRSSAACRWALHSIASVAYGRAPNRAQTLLAGAGALGSVIGVIAAAAARGPSAATDGASMGCVVAECDNDRCPELLDDLDDRVVAAALTALANLVFRHDENRAAALSSGNVVADTECVLAERLSRADSSQRLNAVVEAALFALASLLGDAGSCPGAGSSAGAGAGASTGAGTGVGACVGAGASRARELAAIAAAKLPGSRAVARWSTFLREKS